jgi:hypothetical protein
MNHLMLIELVNTLRCEKLMFEYLEGRSNDSGSKIVKGEDVVNLLALGSEQELSAKNIRR